MSYALAVGELHHEDLGQMDKAMRRSAAAYRQRAVARRLLRELGYTEHPTIGCGSTIGEGAFLSLKGGKHVRTGVATCKRHRLCAVCGQRDAAVRGLIVSAVTWLWMQTQGNDAVFLTLAIPHRREDSLEDVHDTLMTVWHEIKGKCLRKHGVQHVTWVVEHSFGANGPHPQIHAVLLLDRPADDETVCSRMRGEIDLYLVKRLIALGWKRWVGREAVDVRPVDQPESIGAYGNKFSVGAELHGGWDKEGRAKTSVAYQAIPFAVSAALHRRQLGKVDRDTRRLINAWEEYLLLAEGDRRHWHQGFRKAKELLPGLAECTSDQDIIDLCLAVLPQAVAEQIVLDHREEDIDEGAAQLAAVDDADWAGEDPGPAEPVHVHVLREAWQAFLYAWFRRMDNPDRGRLNEPEWRCRRARWMWRTGDISAEPELAACWLLDELGTVAGCRELAEIVGAEVEVDELGVRVGMPHEL